MTIRILSLTLTLSILSVDVAAQAPVGLAAWSAESYNAVSGFGAGQWTVASSGTAVTQSVNGQPTLFYSFFDVFNTQTLGQITANGGDDDYIGFALGFQPGDTTNPAADYLLVDWKKGTQSFNFGSPSCTPSSVAPAGLAVSRVTGIPTADEFWGHVNLDTSPCSGPGDGLVELARATNLGSTGWAANTAYTFQFDFTATQLRVYVDGVEELNVTGIFNNGRLAFYNFSQAGVTYEAFTVNCPATTSSYGTATPGTLGAPLLTLSAPPVLGTTPTFDLTPSTTAATLAFVGVGFAPASFPLPSLGGTLAVDLTTIATITLAPGLTQIPFPTPSDPALCAQATYLQLVHPDPGAPLGLAFSQGLEIVLGL